MIIPEDNDGSQEIVPTAYNYQTTNINDPKNIISASFHMGVGTRLDGPGCEKVYIVKPHADGSRENAWFKITNSDRETRTQQKHTDTILGTRSSGTGRNRVKCFQIPRIQDKNTRMLRN